jgi:ketosteroid isomerase-like protein
MKRLLFTVLPILTLTACGGKKENKETAAPFDLAPIKARIDEMNKTYLRQFTSSDTALYNDKYCADAAVFAPEAPPVRGRDSIRAYYYNNGQNEEITIVIKADTLYGSPQLVAEEGTYDFPDGKGGSFDKGKFIALWKEEGGKWKLFRETWNTNNPVKR